MTDFSNLWNIEKQLWTGPAEAYDELMTADCVMVFPLPAGILQREGILRLVKEAPRWDDVEFDQKRAHQLSDDVLSLTYVGRGLKGTDGYEAFCTSTYVKQDGAWRMAQHQQTPA